MAKYVITKVNKSSRRTKVAKERVEVKLWPLLVCFFLAFCLWLYIAGEDIRREAQQHSETADGYSHVGSGADAPLRDLVSPGQDGQGAVSGQDSTLPGASS